MVVRTPANPTFWWGNFLLFPAAPRAGDAERWDRLFTAALPAARHRAYGIEMPDGEIGEIGEIGEAAELAALRVAPEVSTVLTASGLREPPAPSGAVCRPLAGDGDWAQALQLRLACDDRDGDSEHTLFLRRKLEEARRLTDRGCGAWFGAFVDRRLVAHLGVVSDRGGLARYQSVETAPDFRRRGFAARLLYEALRYAIDERGADTLVIVADPDYHAIDLYRSLGFTDAEQQTQLATTTG